jgi:hypothetical protein
MPDYCNAADYDLIAVGGKEHDCSSLQTEPTASASEINL